MPFFQTGLANRSGNLDNKIQIKIDKFLKTIDKKVEDIARQKGLSRRQVKLLQPLHYCVITGDQTIFLVMSVSSVGSVAINDYQDWSGKAMNIETAVFLVERDLSFSNAFGMQFSKSLIDKRDEEINIEVERIVEKYLIEEIANLEKLNRLVKMDPIFQGREFLLKDDLVFVLCPFAQPFDEIYTDHIKPTIEEIDNLRCLRADDIFDNKSIIEDIWQYINESKIVVSEPSGRNANVFYETGIAHTVGKEVILITQSIEDVPFDLKHLRCIIYDYTPKGVKNLEQNLSSTILNILKRRA